MFFMKSRKIIITYCLFQTICIAFVVISKEVERNIISLTRQTYDPYPIMLYTIIPMIIFGCILVVTQRLHAKLQFKAALFIDTAFFILILGVLVYSFLAYPVYYNMFLLLGIQICLICVDIHANAKRCRL